MIVLTKQGTIRIARVGDELREGEIQIFYRQGPNGGLIFDPPLDEISKRPSEKHDRRDADQGD